MLNFLRRLANNTTYDSLASKLRRRRFRLFKELISAVNKKPLRVLDIGGTLNFWKTMDFPDGNSDLELTLLNLSRAQSDYPQVSSVVGDARDVREFRDGQFDVVLSNSVIEHVGDFKDQKRMAEEIRRLGNGYYVQTPNLYFPLEPHFLFPFFQFLPVGLRALLLKHFRIGWHGPTRDIEKARSVVTSVRLLKKSELARLFPDGRIFEEKFCGFAKSFLVVRPYSAAREREARPIPVSGTLKPSKCAGRTAESGPDGKRRHA